MSDWFYIRDAGAHGRGDAGTLHLRDGRLIERTLFRVHPNGCEEPCDPPAETDLSAVWATRFDSSEEVEAHARLRDRRLRREAPAR